ncbi:MULTISPECIES: hypothetical protein [unclassified Pseudomonas]|uniref:hypothetical protein n=1 Tax=unclassified Pseudomonas TaxID=196821 RepID=UPI0021C5D884|nr:MULTISPECIES: hypothetical protein [unclassified Pseudomonas]MCU1734772.1 hypothetical protein [Pseudomonas sp. 20P_3.2_Bac4]MCU1745337.1 hypothetical protein [Pseudomonas sp. 20P_3.2_Bac5]
MSDQSLNALLQSMQGKSVTRGWDAIVTMNRGKVNQLLEQQYISQFNQNSFLKRIHGSVPLTNDGYEVLELTGLLLSQPRLSFETASLSDSRAHLTMDIVSGMVAYKLEAIAGFQRRITSSFAVTEQHQFTLVMDVDLEAVIGSVGQNGEVVLDLAEGYNFSCNLVDNPQTQQALGNFFHALFKRQPASARRYVLGMLDFDPDDKLAPRNFEVRTQAAPGATVAGSDTYGEGAVVLFVRTRESLFDGSTPGDDSNFRYLIPDDREAGSGKPLYSGSLILASRVLFDWFIQGYLERNVGRGLSLSHTSDSNDLARGLKARAGNWTLDDIAVEHSGGGFHQTASNNVPLTFDFASSAAGSLPFEVSVVAGGLLRFVWKGVNTFSFYFTRKELMGDEKKENANVRFTHTLEFFLKASVDPATSVVTFVTAPGGSSSVLAEKISGDINLYISFKQAFEASLQGLIDSMHGQLKEIRLPELDLFAINHLLFPEQNALLLTHAAVPGDVALFGHINPKHTALKLEPSIVHVLAGTTQQFSVLGEQFKGKAGKLTWSVRSIDGSRSQGDIDQNGRFTAPPRERMVGQAVRNVITVTLEDAGSVLSASALVVVVAESMVVVPGMATVDLGRPEPITVKASSLNGGTIKWTLRSGPGSLQANGNQAVYTPPTSIGQPVIAAHIEAENTSGGAKVTATVLLLQSNFALALAPVFHPGLPPSASTRVRLADDGLPSERVRWSVTAGEGTVDPVTGVFTAPARITMPYSVVQATVEDDFSNFYGYSIIYQSEYASEARWNELQTFELKALSSLQLFANGQQQVEVEIEVEPSEVDFVPVEVSDTELNSIVLVNAHTLEPLPRVDSEGVPVGDNWAYNEQHNDYLFHPNGLAREEDAGTQGIRTRKLYVQTRAGSKTTIAAMLIRDDLMPFYSNHAGNGAPATIEPVPVQPPKFDSSSYKFEATRVVGEDDNDYHLETIDYYILQLTHNGENIPFRHIEFEERSGMVQWESRQFEEDVVSYTGYALRGDTELRFDQGLYEHIPGAVLPELGVVPGEECPEGALLISLHRSQYWRFDLACERTYARPVKLRILDEYGNQHRLQVNFRAPNNRNELRVTVL